MAKQGLPIRCLSWLQVLLAVVLFSVVPVTALEVGDQAPDFILPSTSGDKVSLSQFRGKKHVLIHFYTMDFQPT